MAATNMTREKQKDCTASSSTKTTEDHRTRKESAKLRRRKTNTMQQTGAIKEGTHQIWRSHINQPYATRRRHSKQQTDTGDPKKNDEGERTAKEVHPIPRENKHNTEPQQVRERQGIRSNTETGT